MEKRPDLIETLLHTLIAFNERSTENKIPFVFATATTSHFISAALREKAENLGIGHFCAFAPQHSILNHPATGWFLVCREHLPSFVLIPLADSWRSEWCS